MPVTRKKLGKLFNKKNISVRNRNKKYNIKRDKSRRKYKKIKELHKRSLKFKRGGGGTVDSLKMGGELTEQQQGISGLFSGGNGDGNMYNATGTIRYKINGMEKSDPINGKIKLSVDGVDLYDKNIELEFDDSKAKIDNSIPVKGFVNGTKIEGLINVTNDITDIISLNLKTDPHTVENISGTLSDTNASSDSSSTINQNINGNITLQDSEKKDIVGKLIIKTDAITSIDSINIETVEYEDSTTSYLITGKINGEIDVSGSIKCDIKDIATIIMNVNGSDEASHEASPSPGSETLIDSSNGQSPDSSTGTLIDSSNSESPKSDKDVDSKTSDIGNITTNIALEKLKEAFQLHIDGAKLIKEIEYDVKHSIENKTLEAAIEEKADKINEFIDKYIPLHKSLQMYYDKKSSNKNNNSITVQTLNIIKYINDFMLQVLHLSPGMGIFNVGYDYNVKKNANIKINYTLLNSIAIDYSVINREEFIELLDKLRDDLNQSVDSSKDTLLGYIESVKTDFNQKYSQEEFEKKKEENFEKEQILEALKQSESDLITSKDETLEELLKYLNNLCGVAITYDKSQLSPTPENILQVYKSYYKYLKKIKELYKNYKDKNNENIKSSELYKELFETLKSIILIIHEDVINIDIDEITGGKGMFSSLFSYGKIYNEQNIPSTTEKRNSHLSTKIKFKRRLNKNILEKLGTKLMILNDLSNEIYKDVLIKLASKFKLENILKVKIEPDDETSTIDHTVRKELNKEYDSNSDDDDDDRGSGKSKKKRRKKDGDDGDDDDSDDDDSEDDDSDSDDDDTDDEEGSGSTKKSFSSKHTLSQKSTGLGAGEDGAFKINTVTTVQKEEIDQETGEKTYKQVNKNDMSLLLNLNGPDGNISIDTQEILDKGSADSVLAQTS